MQASGPLWHRGRLVDRLGALASAACAIHCLLTGLAFSILAVAGLTFLTNPLVDWSLFVVAAILGTYAARNGFRLHHDKRVLILFVLGVVALGLGLLVFPHTHHGIDGRNWPQTISMVSGGSLLVTFHWFNSRLAARSGGCATCGLPHVVSDPPGPNEPARIHRASA